MSSSKPPAADADAAGERGGLAIRLGRHPYALLALSVAPLVYTLFDSSDGDVPLYHTDAVRLYGGGLPYRDWTFEYPPWALAWLAVPGLFGGYKAFRFAFGLQALAVDVLARMALLREAARATPDRSRGALGPFCVFAVLGAFQSYFYLKRFDALAASLVVLGLVAFSRDRAIAAGAFIGLAAWTKLYPLVTVPSLLFIALQRGRARALLAGLGLVTVPVVLASAVLPWWRFATIHAARGLQAESTYASIVWLSHFAGVHATWARRPFWVDVDGPLAQALVPWARGLFAAGVTCATALSVASVRRLAPAPSRSAEEASARALAIAARAALLPIVAFMALGVVLSPQFGVWPIGPTALALPAGSRRPLTAVALGVALTALVFPAAGYFTDGGISLERTVVLVFRNAALLVGLGLLCAEAAGRASARRAGSGASDSFRSAR